MQVNVKESSWSFGSLLYY